MNIGSLFKKPRDYFKEKELQAWIYEEDYWTEKDNPFMQVRYIFNEFINEHNRHFITIQGVKLTRLLQMTEGDWHRITLNTVKDQIEISIGRKNKKSIYPIPKDLNLSSKVTENFKDRFKELYQ